MAEVAKVATCARATGSATIAAPTTSRPGRLASAARLPNLPEAAVAVAAAMGASPTAPLATEAVRAAAGLDHVEDQQPVHRLSFEVKRYIFDRVREREE